MCQLFITLDTNNASTLLEKFFKLSKSKPLKDGYGIITKNKNNWLLNKSIKPPYIDDSYKKILNSNFIIAHLRQIYKENMTINAIKNETVLQNTHPFVYRNLYFMHHGDLFIQDSNIIKRFQQYYREPVFQNIINSVHHSLNTKILNNISGNTDSEFIFHIFLQFLHNKDKNMNLRYNMLSSFKQTILYISKLGFQNASNFVIIQDNFILFSNIYENNTTNYIHSPKLYINENKEVDNYNLTVCSSKIVPDSTEIKQNSVYIYNITSKKLVKYSSV